MFSSAGLLVARWEAVPVSPTTLILLGSKQKLVLSRFHICLGENLLSLPSKSKKFRNYELVNIFFSACFNAVWLVEIYK
jgi:hypothetical protein